MFVCSKTLSVYFRGQCTFRPFVVMFFNWPLSRIIYYVEVLYVSEPISWNPMRAVDEKQDIKLLWPNHFNFA